MDLVAPERVGFSSDRLSRIDAHLGGYVEQGKLAGIIAAIARRGQVVYRQMFGQADREAGTPMELDTLLRIYSISKPITSVALMMLYEQGRRGRDAILGRPAGRAGGTVYDPDYVRRPLSHRR